jgi:uncharacterized damage-inducible protein DinB
MAVAAEKIGEVEVWRHTAHIVHTVVRICAGDFTQEESLCQPEPQGNCLNWVLGHLLRVYDRVLPVLGQAPVMGLERLERYGRGSTPLCEPGDAVELKELLSAWDEAVKRLDAGLATLTEERLDEPAPFSPTNYSKETMRSLLTTIFFHQSYHAGQAGMLRRMAGKPGAIG